MSSRTIRLLFLGGFAYAAGTFLIGDSLAILTIWFGFGLLMIVYYWLEWVVTPALAFLMGYQARVWSLPSVVFRGVPLVSIFTLVTPVFSTGSEYMHLGLPWLSVYSKSRLAIVPILYERLTWWGIVFLIGIAAGRVQRHFSKDAARVG